MTGPNRSPVPQPGTPAREAVPMLLEAYGARLYQLGLRNCGSHAEAQDLMQETMIQALQSWDSFQGRSTPSTWLFRIAFRTCRKMHRRRAGEPEVFESLEGVAGLDVPGAGPLFAEGPRSWPGRVDAQDRKRDVRRHLDAALGQLADEFRMALILKDIADFSLEEVSAILDVPRATVKTRVHRARLRLREALESRGVFEPLPPTEAPRQVCLDLVRAKLDAMDRDADFPFPHGEICDRCTALFRSLDLTREACASLRSGSIPTEVRREILQLLERA